ncbi:8385_t:CDS:2 [Acaulospora morrowiae]|uniref:8385_t:CDS:1 n=1 Tax=Acaulospora morrowiae TaxID=94023 RepID=A0A9N9D8P1_9GLOM|nr:8385_t:CDS:2 [Acaulospora morrowiae]
MQSRHDKSVQQRKKTLDPHEEDDHGFVFMRRRNVGAVNNSRNVMKSPVSKGESQSKVIQTLIETPRKPLPNSSVLSRSQESVVPIPLKETPMIRKNKEIRQKKRRSSFEKRGRRASSIGNGFVANPHPDVKSSDFFRHIQPDLPGPKKLRQLLTWCGKRAMNESKTKDLNALKIARIVEQEVLNDLMDSKINTSWYHRRDGHDPVDKTPQQKRQHPLNVENQRRLEEYEKTLQRFIVHRTFLQRSSFGKLTNKALFYRLNAEYEEWSNLISGFNSLYSSIVNADGQAPTNEGMTTIFPDEVDMSVLSEEEKNFLSQYFVEDDNTSSEDKILEEIVHSLEIQVDQIYHCLYNALQFNTGITE